MAAGACGVFILWYTFRDVLRGPFAAASGKLSTIRRTVSLASYQVERQMSKPMRTTVMILGVAFAWLVASTLSEMTRLAPEQPKSAEPRAADSVWEERINNLREKLLGNPEFARQFKAEIDACTATGVKAIECTERAMSAYMNSTYEGK